MAFQPKLKFWGSRGSLSVGDSKIAGNTSCTELELQPGISIFFDAGTGIRKATLGRKFEKALLCLSHYHWDHIQGLPFISNLDASKLQLLTAYADVKERLQVLFDPRFHPVSEADFFKDQLIKHILSPGNTFSFEGIKIQTTSLSHPGGSFMYRLDLQEGVFVYATDSDYEPMSEEAKALMEGADWAVLDCQFYPRDFETKSNFGHSHIQRTVDLALSLKVKTAFLYSFDPMYNDEEIENMEKIATDLGNKSKLPHRTLFKIARESTEFAFT